MSSGREPDTRRQALFGGRGVVSIWDLLRGRPAAPFSTVLSCELEPGGLVGAHRQQRDPEIVIGLSGTGRATVDGRSEPLEAHCVLHLPFGSSLTIENLSDTEPLRYLIVKATAS